MSLIQVSVIIVASISLLLSSWTIIWSLFLTDLAFAVAILMLGLGSLSLTFTVLMYFRFDLFTPLGCFSCLCDVLIFVLCILCLVMLDIAPGFRTQYLLLYRMLSPRILRPSHIPKSIHPWSVHLDCHPVRASQEGHRLQLEPRL